MRWLWLGLALAWAAAFAEDAPRDGGALFAATLGGLDGKPVAMARFRGQPLVVNFWARWCGPCREELPELAKREVGARARGLEVVGIALEDQAGPVRDFAKAYDLDYPIVLAQDQGISLMRALGNPKAGLPFTVALDRQGRVVFSKLGAMQPADFDAAFAAALQP